VFASEIKALLSHPSVEAEPDPASINHYLAFGYVPGTQSALKGIQRLPPANYLMFCQGRIETHRYWWVHYLPKLEIDEGEEACEQIIQRLKEAVQLRMISDVPLGAFLSGGIDSSAVVAMMAQLSSKPVKTFSIGFNEPRYDERNYAREVARKFETEHYEFTVQSDTIDVLDKLVWHYDEPYADSSALPTYYLCKLAREHVTVALNGDAGDENFAGSRRTS
jgi:asparagine synthase (glutamine-hydrolysing)